MNKNNSKIIVKVKSIPHNITTLVFKIVLARNKQLSLTTDKKDTAEPTVFSSMQTRTVFVKQDGVCVYLSGSPFTKLR